MQTIQSNCDVPRFEADEARGVAAWLRIRGSSIEGAAFKVTCQRCGNWLRGNDLTELLYQAIRGAGWTTTAPAPPSPDQLQWVCPGAHRDAEILRGEK